MSHWYSEVAAISRMCGPPLCVGTQVWPLGSSPALRISGGSRAKSEHLPLPLPPAPGMLQYEGSLESSLFE